MMRNVFLCLVLVILSSCVTRKLQIYNNTGGPIKVILYRGGGYGWVVDIPSGHSRDTAVPPEDMPFGIYRSDRGGILWYRFHRYVPDAYLQYTAETTFDRGIQVNPDGRIYILANGESPPQGKFQFQPDGFPLAPSGESVPSEAQKRDRKWRFGGFFRPERGRPEFRFGSCGDGLQGKPHDMREAVSRQ